VEEKKKKEKAAKKSPGTTALALDKKRGKLKKGCCSSH
jgi:hypothetical protein